MNTVNLIGRLTKEIEVKQTQNGVAYANFTLAVNRPYTNQSGEREADFISCVIWRERAENLARMTAKGSQVGITGRIQTRNYDNEQGQRVYITEVVADNFHLIESKEQTAQRRAETGNQGQSTYNYNQVQQPNYRQQQNYTTTELPKQGYNQPQQQQQSYNYNYNQQVDYTQPADIAESDLPF